MKNYAKVFLSVIILGVLFAGSADKPAYKALKGFEPLVGEWVGESESIGIFEGLPDEGAKKTINLSTYRWLLDKTSVQREWKTLAADGKTVINIGTTIYTLDPVTKNIVSTSFGYDGPIYWAGHGRAFINENNYIFNIEEVTINGIYTEYTIQLNLDGKNRLKWQLKNVKQNQKKLPDAPKRLMERK